MHTIAWKELFTFSVSPLETILRGTITYLFILFLLRILLKRDTGDLGMADVLLIVLIADAAQNGMAGEYKSVVDGLLLVTTIVFWSVFIDWLAFRWRAFERFLQPPPLLLVSNGRMQHRNMRREFITTAVLMSMLREEGIEDLNHVKRAYLEANGRISVVRKEASSSR